MKIPKHLPCPCHSQKPYGKCCAPYHQGKGAPTPLALMRSRYSAYALKLAGYIQETTHPESPHYREDKEEWRSDILTFCRGTQFVGLEILEVGEGSVTFKAVLEQGGEDASYTERSTFQKQEGRWLYLEGAT